MKSIPHPSVLSALLLACTLPAQELLWERLGVPYESQLSGPVVTLGDLNGDGYPDLLHRATALHVTNFLDREPQLWFLSGRDGSTLRIRPRISRNQEFGTIAALGDMDGDGVPDYAVLVGAGGFNPPFIQVCSGTDDRVLWQVQGNTYGDQFGGGILGNLDLDGDGRPDVLITAAAEGLYPTIHGAIYAYRNDGTLLYRMQGTPQTHFKFPGPRTIASLGDVDGDGADDFVVGTFEGIYGAGAVFSGRTGTLLHKGIVTQFPWANFGKQVDSAGDHDGDGVTDFILSSTGCSTPAVVLLSGRTGQELRSWIGPSHVGLNCTAFGSSIRSTGFDMDQDGVPDIIVGATQYNVGGAYQGAVFVLSGREQGPNAIMHTIVADDPTRTFPGLGYVETTPPHPDSPFPCFVLPEYDYGYYYVTSLNGGLARGRIRMFRGTPAGAATFGTACQGASAAAPRIGIRNFQREVGPRPRIHLSAAPPGTSSLLLLGLSDTAHGGLQLPLRLDAFGLAGCHLHTSIDLLVPVTTGSLGNQAGYAFVDLPLPLATQSATAVTVFGQWLTLGAGNSWPGTLSAALRWQH